MAEKALAGVRIADFTWVAAGPLAIKYLSDHGAQVVHIESATRPDTLRLLPPFKDGRPGINRSAYNACLNNNKFGLSLNLNHPKVGAVLRPLVQWADVVAENFAPGTMAKWGLAYEDLKKMKPEIIMFSTSQLGQTGPLAGIGAFGAQLVSLAGFTHLTGWPDRDPAGPYGPYTDSIVPKLGAAAIMAALLGRRQTGRGMHIDVSQLESALNFIAPVLLDYSVNGRQAERCGNRVPHAAPHGVYRCRGEDRWCAITVFNEEEWGRLCRLMGRAELAGDPRFASADHRKRHEDELDRIITDWSTGLDAEEVMAALQKAGVAAGVAETGKDLIENDRQLSHRRFFRELDHPEIGKHHYQTPPFRLSATPCELTTPGPIMGEHNHDVCTNLLGIEEREYQDLVNEGVFA